MLNHCWPEMNWFEQGSVAEQVRARMPKVFLLGLGGILPANLKVIPALQELFKYDHDHDP